MNDPLFNDLLESARDMAAHSRESSVVQRLFADMAALLDMGMISREDYDQIRRNAVDAIIENNRSQGVDTGI